MSDSSVTVSYKGTRIAEARFTVSGADFNDLNKSPDRKLPLDLIESLKSNNYIRDGLSIIIIGAAGVGKTWLSCARRIRPIWRQVSLKTGDIFYNNWRTISL